MKEPVLVIIKPDGINQPLVGHIFTQFAKARLKIVAMQILKVPKHLAEKHYIHLRNRPFYKQVIEYMIGMYHQEKNVIAIVYYGEDAIQKCRRIAGATFPTEADPKSIRGRFGKISKKAGVENVVHVSSTSEEAEREIKLWFDPSDILVKLYPTKIQTTKVHKEKVWA